MLRRSERLQMEGAAVSLSYDDVQLSVLCPAGAPSRHVCLRCLQVQIYNCHLADHEAHASYIHARDTSLH